MRSFNTSLFGALMILGSLLCPASTKAQSQIEKLFKNLQTRDQSLMLQNHITEKEILERNKRFLSIHILRLDNQIKRYEKWYSSLDSKSMQHEYIGKILEIKRAYFRRASEIENSLTFFVENTTLSIDLTHELGQFLLTFWQDFHHFLFGVPVSEFNLEALEMQATPTSEGKQAVREFLSDLMEVYQVPGDSSDDILNFQDLSGDYPRVRSQGDINASVGFAIANDLSSQLFFEYKQRIAVSTAWIYTLGILNQNALDPNNVLDIRKALKKSGYFKRTRHSSREAPLLEKSVLKLLQSNGICEESQYPYVGDNARDFFPKAPVSKEFRKYGVESFLSLEFVSGDIRVPLRANGIPTDVSFFKRLLSKHIAPIVTLNRSSRVFLEDWITPIGPNDEHSVVVVGFGKDFSPFDGQYKDYFLILDSQVPSDLAVPFKIDAEVLTSMVIGIYKITGVSLKP